MTLQEELDMLRRRHESPGMSEQEAKRAVGEHLALLDEHRRLSGFDVPGVYDPGPLQTGEGGDTLVRVADSAPSSRSASTMFPTCSTCSARLN